MTDQPNSLEDWVDESIKRSRSRGYHPTVFIGMRERFGTRVAIEHLVRSGEIQSGFHRLRQLGMLTWSIEAAVRQFPDEFTAEARECAEFRLNNVDDPILRVR